MVKWASQIALVVKSLPAHIGDIRDKTWTWSWAGKIPGERHGNPLQYSCLENPRDRGAWQAVVQSRKELNMTEAT